MFYSKKSCILGYQNPKSAYYTNPASSRRRRVAKRSALTDFIILSKILRVAFFGLLAAIVFFFIGFLWVSKDLPTPGKLSNPDVHDSTRILDKNGIVLYSIYKDYNRLYVPLSNIPKNLRDATIATEDKDFYKNPGVSIWAYGRVMKDILLRKTVTGGSTITQQLVKNVLLSPERSLIRKFKEAILAVEVDQKYSKDQILELYLNNVPYGGTAVGIEAASALYFDKHAKDLSLAQSAFIAGLPQAPSYYSPYSGNGKKAYLGRTKHVLNRMNEEGIISKKQVDEAYKEVENFTFSERQGNLKAPHFVMYVKNQLVKLFGEQMVANGNLEVKTTLDYEIQKNAEAIVNDEIDKLKGFNVGNGAAVVMDPKTGGILSMVGSRNYFDTKREGNFNAAVALRQPGSSLKPIMYATAFEKGYTPATLIMDVKTDFPTDDPVHPMYIPVNYDGKFRGPMQLRFALGNSENIPAVKMLARVGIKPVMQKAYDMGIENWKPTDDNMKNVGLSLVLGGREATLLQIVTAYSVFANQGIKKEPYAITEVKDKTGKVLYKHQDVTGGQVLSREVTFLISHILLDNNAREMAFGPYSSLVVSGKTVSVKTGTTDSKRDNWTVGYTPSYVVGVWVGNNDNSAMNPRIASGITGATPIWNSIISTILKGKADEQPKVPDGITSLEIDALGGGLPVDGKPKRSEYFVKGTEPSVPSPIYRKVKLSKQDPGKLASDDEVASGNYDVKDFIVFQENDPVSKDGKNRWQEGIDSWIRATYAADHPEYYPPTEKSGYSSGQKPQEEKKDENKPSSPTLTPTPTSLLPTITP